MSVANKIFQNTLWQVILRAVNIMVGIFNLALITRILGQTDFGFYTTIFAFVQMFMILADLGLYLTLLRESSVAQNKEEENKITSNIFTIRLLFSLLAVALIPLVVQFFPYDSAVKGGVIFFAAAFFFQSLISTLTATFSKHLAMPKVSAVDLFNKILYLILLYYLFIYGGDLDKVLITQSVAYLVSFGIFWVLIKKYVTIKLAWDFPYWKKIFHTTWPLALTVVLNLVYFKADTLVLSAYFSPDQVGLYGAAYRVLEVLSTFPHMFMSLVLPLMTAAWVGRDMTKLKEVWQNSFDFFSIVCIGMICLTWLISTPVMALVAGPEFAESGPILNWLVVATATIFFGTLYTYLVVAIGRQKQMIKYFLIAALIGLAGYYIFIPLYSYWGAAGMTLAIEALIWFFAYIVVRQHVKVAISWKVFGKSFLAGIITMLFAFYISISNPWVILVLSAGVYILSLFIFKAVDQKKLKAILLR